MTSESWSRVGYIKIVDKTSWEGAGTKEGFLEDKRLKI